MEFIKEALKNKRPKPEGIYNVFGVMVPMIDMGNGLHLLMEVRSTDLKSQPGEISLPGGRMEEGETPDRTALRETAEELLIPEDNISVIGALDYLVTPFNYIIYPYVGIVEGIDVERIEGNPGEVDEVFTVPLHFFLNSEPMGYKMNVIFELPRDFPFELIPNGSDYGWKTGEYPVYFYPYKDYIIWGITARIIKNLVDALQSKM